MKTYEATFKNNSEGVFSISLVESPATEETFIALSKQEIKLTEVDKEQRLLLGLVLQPDQKIYRNQGGEEFNIVFKSDTIKELSHNFFKSGFQLNSKLEHQEPIKGVTFVESWIVENSAIDKSANFGFNYPKGSWVATMKVDNDDIWNNYVKTGKIQGFSVDAMVDLKEVNLKSNIKMAEEKKSLLEQIEVWFTDNILNKKEEITFGSVQSGDVNIEYEGDVLEVGTPLFTTVEDERVPLPDGEYPTDMGLLVVMDGSVSEIKTEEAPVEEVEAEAAPSVPDATDQLQAIKSLLIKYNEDIDTKLAESNSKVESLITELKKENESLKNEVTELSKQPVANPIKSEAVQVELNRKGRLLEKIRKNK